jgi:hypothetical protein
MIFHETNPVRLERRDPPLRESSTDIATNAPESVRVDRREAFRILVKALGPYANWVTGFGKNVEYVVHATEPSWRSQVDELSVISEEAAIPISISADADAFIRTHDLEASVNWLGAAALETFDYAYSEIALVPAEENEADRLCLKVNASFNVDEFTERKRKLRNAMRSEGHTDLYGVLGIYQRRMQNRGWQKVSFYRASSGS